MQPAPLTINAAAHVMVVEDEALIRMSLAEEFRDAGFTVIEAASGEEAWAYVKSGAELHLIVTDVQMPGAMNGLELAGRIRQQDPHIPIILVSSNITQSEILHLGTLVTKPYDPPDLITLAIKTLGLSGSNRSE